MPQDTKEMIAEATRRLLVEKRVKKLTVKDIVEECRITRQTFYYHFEDIPDLFRWVLERDGEKMLQEAFSHGNAEQGLRYFFQMAVSAAPSLKRGVLSSYQEELQRMLMEYCYRFFERIVEQEGLYPGCSRAEIRLFARYHSHALLGFLQDWTEEDTKNLDSIVHTLYGLISGAASPRQENKA